MTSHWKIIVNRAWCDSIEIWESWFLVLSNVRIAGNKCRSWERAYFVYWCMHAKILDEVGSSSEEQKVVQLELQVKIG